VAAQIPDLMIAISSEVRSRIKKCYRRESEIKYPPVDVEKFKNQNLKFRFKDQVCKSDYYLIVSRLEAYKKVDLAISILIIWVYPLVIIGIGSERQD
jgi:glycosyltransferase involved in cell wall biosynthesis